MKRRDFFLSALALAVPSAFGKLAGNFQPVVFTWRFHQPLSKDEALELERRFVNEEKLLKLNESFVARGWLKWFSSEYFPGHAEYRYAFDRLESYVKWDHEVRSANIVDYSAGKELFKIENSTLKYNL
jgi:hypothetical protein